MTAMTAPRIVFAQASLSTSNPHTGLLVSMIAGEAWYADDPFVVSRPDLFGEMPPKIRGERGRPVESASAAPGEKRATKRG
jgi:hypothetical protein